MFTKYARLEDAEILDIRSSEDRARKASLNKFSEFNDYRTEDGYLYARIRAISSRVNKNHDGWPSIELAGGEEAFNRISKQAQAVEADSKQEYGYSTFLGKPVFVDHHNTDPERARGVIVDAKIHIDDHKTAAEHDSYYDSAPDNHMPPTWVELLLEVDAKSFPRLAKAIIDGKNDAKAGIDGFSMGCDVEKSVCNICKNAAFSPDDYCEHVRLKGAHFDYIDEKTSAKTSKKSYEDCYGIKFFEISAVFDPADETALVREVRSSIQKEARTAEAPLPQSDLLHAPEEVDTLREETVCPVCGSTMDETTCEICGYVEPPDGLDNPDLDRAKPEQDMGFEPTPPPHEGPLGETGLAESGLLEGNNPQPIARVKSDMPTWKEYVHPKVAARINVTEKPIKTSEEAQTDEPDEKVIQDEPKPVTSSARTMEEFVEAAGRGKENEMSDNTKVAAEPVPAASPDTRTEVDGVGGVADASNEQASKADAQVDVEGKGGTGVEGVSADQENVNVDQGDEHSKNIEGTDTDTWSGTERQTSPVQGETFPSEQGQGAGSWSSANKGTTPVDPVGNADDRVDVEQEVSVAWNQSGKALDQWTGTDGNAVTRQQDPVTNETLEGEDIINLSPTKSSSHIFAAIKLADLEVELGLLDADNKYERMAELEEKSPDAIEASLEMAQKVKTAGLKRHARTASARRLPSMTAATTQSSDTPEVVVDESLFL